MRPKFYWFDPGVARQAAGFGTDPADRAWRGFALETLLFHELRVFNETSAKHRAIAYYHTASGVEIDFIVETRTRREGTKPSVVCIEVKSAERWDRSWDRAMRDLAASNRVHADGLYGVYQGSTRLHFDGVHVLPVGACLPCMQETCFDLRPAIEPCPQFGIGADRIPLGKDD